MNDTPTPKWRRQMDRAEHENTYRAFLNYSKWGIIACALILLFLLLVVYD